MFSSSGGGGTSISKLQTKVNKAPANAQAWRDLATALEQKQRTQEAVNALERYVHVNGDRTALAAVGVLDRVVAGFADRCVEVVDQRLPALPERGRIVGRDNA